MDAELRACIGCVNGAMNLMKHGQSLFSLDSYEGYEHS